MADVKVSIKDETSATQWLQMVKEINSDYNNAMGDASQCLIEMGDFCEGTLVDDFVSFGNQLVDAAKKTFDAIDAIADTVNTVLGLVDKFKESAVGGIAKLVSKVIS